MTSANPPVKPEELIEGNPYYIRSKVDFVSPPGENEPLIFLKREMKKEWLGGTWNNRYRETVWENKKKGGDPTKLIQNNWYYFNSEPSTEDILPAKLRIEEYTPVYDLDQYALYYVRRRSDFEAPGYPDDSNFTKPLQFLGFHPQNDSFFSFNEVSRNRRIDIPKDNFYYFLPSENLDNIPSHNSLEFRLQYRKRARTNRNKRMERKRSRKN